MNLRNGILTAEIFADLPLEHGFTTRAAGNLGYGKNPGDPIVTDNRSKLFEAAGLLSRRLIQPKQIHSSNVVPASEFVPGLEADASISKSDLDLLSVLTADCVPILIYHPEHIAAAIHAGWRGLSNGIIKETLKLLPDGGFAAIGPAIGPCCYEVGEDLAADFASRFGESAVDRNYPKPHLDLVRVAIHQLMDAGLNDLEASHLCTACHPDLFFSYRRDGSSGRQMSFIGLKTL